MRTVDSFKGNAANLVIEISADGKGPGGASHSYNVALGVDDTSKLRTYSH